MSLIPKYILAPHVPTSPEIIERFFTLAQVTANDVVCDLGCGDGRVAIAAAKRFGARAVGVDHEQYWIDESRRAAEEAGVGHLASFHQADALSFDVSEASVIYLYLVDWSLEKMLTRLFQEAKPGTRIVSLTFPSRSIEPAQTTSFEDAEGQVRTLRLWIVPDRAAMDAASLHSV